MPGQTTSTAPGLLNVQTVQGIIPLAQERSELLSLPTRRLNGLRARSVKPRRETARLTADWLATETSAKPVSKPSVEYFELNPNELALITIYSEALARASEENYDGYVRDVIARTVQVELERVFINGVGASHEPVGLMQASLAASHSITYSSGEIGDVIDAGISRMRKSNMRTDAIIMPTSLVHTLAIARTQTDEYLYPEVRGGTFRGVRIVETNLISTPAATAPATTAILVDRSQLVWGTWAGSRVVESIHASVDLGSGTIESMFQMDQVAVRFHGEYDLALARNTGICRIGSIPVVIDDAD